MGLLDRFRGDKGDKEDELEENIEKIREKIQSGGSSGDIAQPPRPGERETERTGGDAPRPPAAGEEGQSRAGRSTDEESGPRPTAAPRPGPGQGESRAAPSSSPQEDETREAGRGRPGGESPERPERERTGVGPEMPSGEAGGRRGGRSTGRPAGGQDEAESVADRESLPEPPEVKELDVSEVEGGSLYVTVDTFRDALQTVADLRTLARDLDDHVGSMEGTLDEDRETAAGVEELLDTADDRIGRMRDLMTE